MIAMPKRMSDGLMKLKHAPPSKPEHSPEQHVVPTSGAKIQCAEDHDESPVSLPEDVKFIQRAIGLTLCCAFDLDSTNLVSLRDTDTE